MISDLKITNPYQLFLLGKRLLHGIKSLVHFQGNLKKSSLAAAQPGMLSKLPPGLLWCRLFTILPSTETTAHMSEWAQNMIPLDSVFNRIK